MPLLTVGAWLTFGVANAAIRLIADQNVGAADGLSIAAAQSLQLGYQVGQPPLYDWLLWLVLQTGVGAASGAYIVKYTLLVITAACIYGGATRISGEPRIGALAALAPMALFNVGFTVHDQSTHSVALIAAIAMTFLGFVQIASEPKPLAYVLTGVGMGLGLLSKHGFIIMPLAMMLAMLAVPALRERVLSRWFAGAVVMALCMALPFMLWVWFRRTQFSEALEVASLAPATRWTILAALEGVLELLASYLVYAAPAVPLLWLIWPKLLQRGASPRSLAAGDLRAVLGLALALSLAIAVLVIAVTGVTTMRSRYMHVLALLLPVYVALYVDRAELTRRRLLAFVAVVAELQMVQVVARGAVPLWPQWPLCRSCDVIEPIDDLAAELTRRQLANATLVVPDHQLAGNLLRHMPAARVVTLKIVAPPLGAPRPCALVVDAASKHAVGSPGDQVTLKWPSGYSPLVRSTTWQIVRLEPSDQRCRTARS